MANGSQNQSPGLIRSRTMSLSAEQAEAIKNELKRFAGDLNLSDEQKTKLHERLASAAEKLHEYKKSHPDVTRQDIIKAVASHRTELRAAVERFLTPEQLKKWDAEVAKAKEFLGFDAAWEKAKVFRVFAAAGAGGDGNEKGLARKLRARY